MLAAVASVACFVVSAQAETALPASASFVRNAVVAMSLADAAPPAADAIAMARDVSGSLPAATVVKSGPSDAMASMRTASARRYATASAASFYDRRVRAYRDPFLLILGVAY